MELKKIIAEESYYDKDIESYSFYLDYGRDYFLFGEKFYFYSYSDENEILVYDY